jgi:hypothetical protein
LVRTMAGGREERPRSSRRRRDRSGASSITAGASPL